jgi:hypothetical protein
MGAGRVMAKVTMTQYLRPYGTRCTFDIEVPEEYAPLAIGLVLSCEALPSGAVALYARREDQDEEDEDVAIANNVSDPNAADSPQQALLALIKKVSRSSGLKSNSREV